MPTPHCTLSGSTSAAGETLALEGEKPVSLDTLQYGLAFPTQDFPVSPPPRAYLKTGFICNPPPLCLLFLAWIKPRLSLFASMQGNSRVFLAPVSVLASPMLQPLGHHSLHTLLYETQKDRMVSSIIAVFCKGNREAQRRQMTCPGHSASELDIENHVRRQSGALSTTRTAPTRLCIL